MATIPMRVALGCDNAGFQLKQTILDKLSPLVIEIIDCGSDGKEACDFPDTGGAVAREVVTGRADRGIAICGSGVGMCIAANKIPGARACLCHDYYSAHQGVEHDDMNILCLGGRIIGPWPAFEIVTAFLNAEFDRGEDFVRRVNKIIAMEKRGLDALENVPIGN